MSEELETVETQLDVVVSDDNIANINVYFERPELLPYQKQFIKEKQKHVILRGYRKGTAPENMVAKFFAEEAAETAKNTLLYNKYIKLLQDHKLQPLSQPRLERLVEDADKVKAAFSVEVLQPIALTQYLGLDIQKMPSKSIDDEVANTLKKIKHSYPKLVEQPDAVVNNGDVAVVSFVMSINGEEKEKQEDLKVLLGSKLYYVEFENNLLGLKANDTKEFDVDFPAEYQRAELRNTKAHFILQVKSVNHVAEYSDEELAGVLQYENKDVMISSIKQEAEQKNREEEHLFYENQILGQLLSVHQFKIPKSLLDTETQKILTEKPETLPEQAREIAERFVRTDLIMQAIYERHPDIHLTEATFQEQIAVLANKAQDSVDNVVKKLQATNKLQAYFNYLKNCRVIDFLIETAEKHDGPVEVVQDTNVENIGEEING